MQISGKIERLSKEMSGLKPGMLAELRRMDNDGPGAAAYWFLAVRCGFVRDFPEPWMQLVKILAILTPRGESDDRKFLHDRNRRLGAVLCDGGDLGWSRNKGIASQPFISESRLARLLNQSPDQRPITMERFARMLVRKRDPQTGINCVDIALLILPSGESAQRKTLRMLAESYYRRLDDARHQISQGETIE